MSPRYTLRLLAFVVLLLLAVPIRTAGATSHAATADDGASTDTSLMIEQAGLVPTNGGPGSFTMEETPVLVGSGADREEVARNQTPVLVGSGAEREEVARQQTPVLVGSNADREEVAVEADWSEAEMIRGGLSPIGTVDVAVVEVQAIASGEPEIAGIQNELTINGVRVE